MLKTDKSPVRLTIGYNLWGDEWEAPLVKRFEKARYEYIDICDTSSNGTGTGRMSKRMAEKFVVFLKNAIASGSIPVDGVSESWGKKKHGSTVGIDTGEMLDSITAFRTNLSGEKKHKGWVVSIKENVKSSREFPMWYKLSWLEYGTVNQPERPLIARAFEQFVGQGWVKQIVEDMILRGVGMTEARRAGYNGTGEE